MIVINNPIPLGSTIAIADELVPLADAITIVEEDVPLADTISIVEEDVPLASMPKTGDDSKNPTIYALIGMIAMVGAYVINKKSKKSE